MNNNFENNFCRRWNERRADLEQAQDELEQFMEQFDDLAFDDAADQQQFNTLVSRRDCLRAVCREFAALLGMMNRPNGYLA